MSRRRPYGGRFDAPAAKPVVGAEAAPAAPLLAAPIVAPPPAEEAPAAPVAASLRSPFVGHCGVRFRGRDYERGEPFPFDPQSPPADVSGEFVEGLHYVYR